MATIEKLLDDLSIIARLSDYPGSEDGLSTDAFKAKFDEAGLTIQAYINDVLIPYVEGIAPEGGTLPLTGGTMMGPINMNGRKVTDLATPTNSGDAANKSYVDGHLPKSGGTMTGAINMGSKKITNLAAPTNNNDAANKSYVDSKRLSGTVILYASAWSGGAQETAVSGILASDMPHWGIVYGEDSEAEKEAYALVDVLETSAGKFTFRCFGDVPTVDLVIQWEVNR